MQRWQVRQTVFTALVATVLGGTVASCGGGSPGTTGSDTSNTGTSQTTPSVPAPSPSGSVTAPATPTFADPASVVNSYIAAVNSRDYVKAYRLGGRNFSPSYQSFAQGFSGTDHDVLVVRGVRGDTVQVYLLAYQTDGSEQHYEGTYTVSGGVITGASLTMSSPTPGMSSPTESPESPNQVSEPWTLIGRTTNDPVVDYYYRSCPLHPDIDCLSQGFELDITATKTPGVLVVYQVVLYSNRNTGFSQYSGTLPMGLTWADTYPNVINKLGQPINKSGGFGTDITYSYTKDGYKVELEFVARHDADLPNSLIHDIKVSRM